MTDSNSDSAGRMVYLHALSPIHSGTGQSAAVIDLPIAREKSTGWPIIPATSLKGVIRDALAPSESAPWFNSAFGKVNRQDDSAIAGALCFGDQRILCLPVRSYFGTFAYVTCALALKRFARDARALGAAPPWNAPTVASERETLVGDGGVLASKDKVYLEDLNLDSKADRQAAVIGGWLRDVLGIDDLPGRFAIVADDVFGFLCETATEVSARIRLEEQTKTVADGQLWYEEAVPAEAIFAGPLLVADHGTRNNGGGLSEAMAALKALRMVQIGGKASVGRGLCRLIVQGVA